MGRNRGMMWDDNIFWRSMTSMTVETDPPIVFVCVCVCLGKYTHTHVMKSQQQNLYNAHGLRGAEVQRRDVEA